MNSNNTKNDHISSQSTLNNNKRNNSNKNDDNNNDNDSVQLTPKDEVTLKREAKKIAEAANFTFKPKLIQSNLSKRWSLDNSPQGLVSNRFDRLYSDAQKRKEEEKERHDKIIAVSDKDLTFQPKISPRAASRERSSSNSSTPNSSKKMHIERMYHSTGSGRSSTPTTDMKEQHNFSPQITKRASSIDRSHMRESGERLYSLSQIEREKHEKAKLEADKIEMSACTFSPTLVTSRPGSRSSSAQKGRRSPSSHISERMQLYEEKRRKHIEEALKMKLDREAAEITFKPAIATPTFKTKDDTPSNVFERLTASVDKKATDSPNDESFIPKTNSGRPMTPTNLKRLNSYNNVHDRLYQEAEQRRALMQVERDLSIQELEKDITFKPKIIYPPMREESEVASNYTGDSVFDRLSTSRQYMHNMLAQMKSDMELYDCTFQPHTSASEILAKSASSQRFSEPVYERLNKEAEVIKQVTVKNEEKVIEKEMMEATFAPKIPKKSEVLANKKHSIENSESSKSLSPEIHQRLNAEAAVIRTDLMKREELKIKEELKEATFAPHIPISSEKIALKRATVAIPHPSKTRERSKSPINERLYEEAVQIKSLKDKQEKQREITIRNTSRPHIPKSSEIIVAHKRESIVAAQVESNENKIEARIESLRKKLAGNKKETAIDSNTIDPEESPIKYQENPVRSPSATPRSSQSNAITNGTVTSPVSLKAKLESLEFETQKSTSGHSPLTLSPRVTRVSTLEKEPKVSSTLEIETKPSLTIDKEPNITLPTEPKLISENIQQEQSPTYNISSRLYAPTTKPVEQEISRSKVLRGKKKADNSMKDNVVIDNLVKLDDFDKNMLV